MEDNFVKSLPGGILQCTICMSKFSEDWVMERHVVQPKFKCETCEATFCTKQYYKEHSHPGGTGFSCIQVFISNIT